MLLKRHIHCVAAAFILLLAALSAQAQRSVALSSAQGHPGDEVQLDVSLNGSGPVTAFQMTIPLPSCISYVEASATLNLQCVTASHQLSVSQVDGQLKIYVYSLSLALLQDGEGELLHFSLKLGKTPGDYQLHPDVVLSDKQGKAVDGIVTDGTVTILSPWANLAEKSINFGRVPILGTYTKAIGVDNTGNEPLEVSGIDCSSPLFSIVPQTATVAPGQTASFTLTFAPQHYGEEQATVSIRSNAVNGTQAVSIVAQPYSVNKLAVEAAPVPASLNDEVTVSVSLQNMEPIVAAQCSFLLTEAMEYVDGSATLNAARSNGHQLSTLSPKVELEGTSSQLTFYLHSPDNKALQGSDGLLFTFRLRLVGTGGTYMLTPTDVILANIEGMNMTSDVSGTELRIAAPKVEAEPSLHFGNVPMEQTAKVQFVLNNTGELPLTIERIEFSDPVFSYLIPEEEWWPSIPAGQEGTLTVTCQPAGEGAFSGTMLVYTNDPDHRMIAIALEGTAYPTCQLVPDGHCSTVQGQYTLDVALQNSLPIVGLQFDIHWLADMETEQVNLTLSSHASNHQALLTKVADGLYRVFVYSMDNSPIAIGDGLLLSIIYNNVRAKNDFLGTTLTIDNVILSTLEEVNRASSITAQLLVLGRKGDVNGDGQLTITDVAATIAYILEEEPENCNKAQADVNGDGEITVADVVAIVDLMMKEIIH